MTEYLRWRGGRDFDMQTSQDEEDDIPRSKTKQWYSPHTDNEIAAEINSYTETSSVWRHT